MKKYALIAALVPASEHFDESAIVNEGGYLSTKHLDALEDKLKVDAAAIAAQPAALQTLTDSVTELTTANKASGDALALANATIEANKTEIETLKAQVATLKKEPAAAITSTTKSVDEPITGGKKVAFHESPENPANKMADKLIKTKKAAA